MRTSPVLFDTHFQLPHLQEQCFTVVGHQRKNRGITHVVYLKRSPMTSRFNVGESNKITGYCSYRLLFNERLLCGVVFTVFGTLLTCNPYKLVVANYGRLPETFETSHVLENMNLMMFSASDSSLVVVPTTYDHVGLLVRDKDPKEETK